MTARLAAFGQAAPRERRPIPPTPGILAAIAGFLAGFVLLALPRDADAQSPTGVVRSTVDGQPVEVLGATLYDPAHLVAYAEGVLQQEGGSGLDGLARRAERLYHEDGYFLARVTSFRDDGSGRRGLIVEEGGVSQMEILGVEPRIAQRIADYIRPTLDGRPLRLQDFERALLLAGDLGGVRVRSDFTRDPATGANKLVVHAEQSGPRFYALADNTPRSSTGNAIIGGEFTSIVMPGDLTRLALGGSARTNGKDSGFLVAGTHRTPVGVSGTYLEVFGANTLYGRDLSGGFSDDRHQRGELYVGLVGHPLVREVDQSLYLLVEGSHARTESSGGALRAEDRSSAFRLSAYYTAFDHETASFRVGPTLSAGEGYSRSNPNVDGSFWHARLVAGMAMRLGDPAVGYGLRLEGYSQLTSSSLPETERFYLGDRERMRGYAIGTVTGDTGTIGTIEVNRHIQLDGRVVHAVVPAMFLDMGFVERNHDFPVITPRAGTPVNVGNSSRGLMSTGIAARTFLAEGFSLSGWLGVPLQDDGRDVRYKPAGYVRLTKSW